MATTLRWIYSADTAMAAQAVNRYADSVNALSRSMAANKAVQGDSQVQIARSAALVTDMRNRVAELDRQLARQRVLGVDDKGASASIARLQVQASRLQDTLGKENIDSRGAARLEAQLLALEATAGRLQDKMSSGIGGRGGSSGLLGRAAGGALGGLAGSIGPGLGAAGLGAGVGVLGALAVAATQAAAALAAAGAGVAAFGALSLPTFKALSTGLGALSTATDAYSAASANLNIAIHHSPADLKDYQATIRGLEPDLQNAARLLTNQHAVWQNLSPSMQKSVVSLANNATAYKALLPAQKTALTALLAQKTAWDELNPRQQTAATGIQALGTSFGRLANKLAPVTFKVLNEGLKVANTLLPSLLPFATAAGNAIAGLLKGLEKFTAPAAGTGLTGKLAAISALPPPTGFQKFLTTLQALSGPAITALGNGLGQIAIAVGKLITAAAQPDSIKVLARILGFLATVIDVAAWAITRMSLRMQQWIDVAHQTANKFDEFRHDAARVFAAVATIFDQSRHMVAIWGHDVAHTFDSLRHSVPTVWDNMWTDVKNVVTTSITTIVGWFKRLPALALGALSGFGHSLYAFAHAALTEFLDGLKAVGGTVLGWLKNFIGGIPHAIMSFLHMSPPHAGSVFYDLGANLMHHLEAGIKSTAHKAVAAAQATAHRVANAGAGVQRWAGLVRKALAMEGLSPGLVGNVLFQMQTESGGNPNAINLTDSNAQHGDPSRGLMQTIMGTFQAYHWPGTSSNIYDPLANIAAALNYARHRYGPSLMSGGMGIGSGHGYALGGVITEPITGFGRSGRMYTFGERGPETVIPGTPGAGPGASMARVEQLLAQLINETRAAPARTGDAVGGALHGATRSAYYSGRYSPR